MNKITLDDIIMKKLNNTNDTPDELVNDAYAAMLTAEHGSFEDKAIAYIKAKTAIRANENCGFTVAELEIDTACLKKDMSVGDQEIADFYMEHLDK